MHTPTQRLALAAFVMAASLSPSTGSAQQYENAFDRVVKAQLRCWYKESPHSTNLKTGYIDTSGVTLMGQWRSLSALREGALFFTVQDPADMTEACERALAAKGKGPLIQASAASGSWGKNYQIWHEGNTSSRHGQPVERIVSFGDSLSDTGNIYNELLQTFPIHTSWFLGRFSNGPVWTEYLAKHAGAALNTWATGGAQSNDAYGVINGIKSQVDSFLRYVRINEYRQDMDRILFTVWVGSNDAMNGRSANDVIADLEKGLDTLTTHGARKIVLLGLPDLTRIPAFRPIEGTNEPGRSDIDQVYRTVNTINEALPGLAKDIAARTGAEIVWIDAASRFDEVMTHPDAHGFSDVTRPCLELRSQGSQVYLGTQKVRSDCAPERYVFWDMVHPTTRMHELISQWVLAELPSTWKLQ